MTHLTDKPEPAAQRRLALIAICALAAPVTALIMAVLL